MVSYRSSHEDMETTMDIAILLYPRFTALDAMGPLEVLSSLPGARVQFVADQPGPITNDTAILTVQVDSSLDGLPNPDIVLVPGGPGCAAAMQSEPILTWLRNAHTTTRWTTSVCTGSLVLGAAGLLQGVPATTHWGSWAALEPLGSTFVRAGFVQHGKIIMAAGVSAAIDMTIWIMPELADEPTMQATQLLTEYDPQPPLPMITPPTTR